MTSWKKLTPRYQGQLFQVNQLWFRVTYHTQFDVSIMVVCTKENICILSPFLSLSHSLFLTLSLPLSLSLSLSFSLSLSIYLSIHLSLALSLSFSLSLFLSVYIYIYIYIYIYRERERENNRKCRASLLLHSPHLYPPFTTEAQLYKNMF